MFLLYLLGLAVGVAILVKSADLFTDAAVAVARRLRIPEIVVGATLVSLATTLPEFSVSLASTLKGNVDFAVGNAVGSTICNVGLILGICAVLAPMAVVRKGFLGSGLGLLVLAAVFGILGYLYPDGSRVTGLVMVACLVVYLVVQVFSAMRNRAEEPEPGEPEMTVKRIVVVFVLSATGVVGGSYLMVECGKAIAVALKVLDLVVGVTFLAIGTSTPELVVSITGIIKKQRALSIGNIIGANILNLAWVIGVCSLVRPLPVQAQTLRLDIPVMLLLSVLLLVFGITDNRLSRGEGAFLFTVYVTWMTVMFLCFGMA